MSAKTKALSATLGHLDLLPPVIVEESAALGAVLDRMRAERRGSVVVCKDGAVTGVYTERDYLYKHSLERLDPKTPIGAVMSARPVTVSPNATLGEAIEVMNEKRFRNLPIVDEQGRPQGLLTVGRIIRYLAENFPAEVVNLPPKLQQVTHETEGA